MRKFIALIVSLTAVMAAAGCATQGNGVLRTIDYPGKQVSKIEVKAPFDVKVFCNAKENRVVLKAENNLFDDIKIVSGDKIKIVSKSSVRPTLPMTLEVYTAGDIVDIELGQSAKAVVSDNKARKFEASLEDAAELTLTGADMDYAEFSLEDTALLKCDGKIKTCELESSDASHCELNASFATLEADLENSSSVTVNGKVGRLEADMENSSSLTVSEADSATVKLENSPSLRIITLNFDISGKAAGSSSVTFGGTGKESVRTSGSAVVRKNDK